MDIIVGTSHITTSKEQDDALVKVGIREAELLAYLSNYITYLVGHVKERDRSSKLNIFAKLDDATLEVAVRPYIPTPEPEPIPVEETFRTTPKPQYRKRR